jgi:CrcB protein
MARSWTPKRVAAVAGGGVLGAVVRWAVVDLTSGHGLFPWPVLGVNVVGSLLLGALLAEEWSRPRARLVLHDAGAIGFCGGLTTFSTFAVEVADLFARGHPVTATTYTAASILGGLVCVVAGAAGLRQTRALTLPVEEEP